MRTLPLTALNGPAVAPLPAALSLLFGREQDLQKLTALLRGSTRLITLRGPGGIGKTALALEAARALQTEFDLGAVLVELAALTDPADVLPAVARTLRVPLHSRTASEAIASDLEGRSVLLVLDNFEQVRGAALDLKHLLEMTTHLKILATSRVALHLHDEQGYPVGPLGLPSTPRAWSSSPAVQLLVDRIRHHDPAFGLTREDERAAVQVCRSLEGIPLALELAAAATRTFSLPDLAARLEQSVGHLHATFLDRPERLRSLQSTVEWSYNLLPAELQALFTCCAVFHGGFKADALRAVWNDDTVLDLLPELLDQSLLQRVPGQTSRWRMLEPLRELAVAKLSAHPQASVWRRRHAEYYATLFEQLLQQPEEQFQQAQGHLERPNLKAALEWATEQQDVDLAFRALSDMGFFYIEESGGSEGFQRAQRVLALPAAQHHPHRVKGLHLAWNCVMNHDPEAHTEVLYEWVELSHAQGDLLEMLWSLNMLGGFHHKQGQVEEASLRTRELFERLAAAEQDTTLTPETTLEIQRLHAWAVHNTGARRMYRGRYAEAEGPSREAIERFTRSGHEFGRLCAMTMLADIQAQLGRPEAASTLLEELMGVVTRGRFQGLAPRIAQHLSTLAESSGSPADAVRFMVLAERLTGEFDAPMGQVRGELEPLLERVKSTLDCTHVEEAQADGLRMTLEEAWARWQDIRASVRRERTPGAIDVLTAREREVLTLVAQGHPDRRIAKLLGISPSTASKHVANLLGKLGLRNRVELARWTMQHEPSAPT